MPAPALTVVYADRESVDDVLSATGTTLRIDDSGDGVEQAAETALVTKACSHGTAKVNRYCLGKYDAAELVKSSTAWEWASIFAAIFLCRRRGNKPPKALIEWRNEIVDELRELQAGRLSLHDCTQRQSALPSWSNVIVDTDYRGKKIRVQRPQSDGTPRERPVATSWPDEFIVEP